MKLAKVVAIGLVISLASSVASAGLFSKLVSLITKDTYTQTKYPIVLVNGLFGFDKLAGVDYWYQIPNELSRSGAKVYVAQVQAAGQTEVRGEQLARQVENILAATGAKKVNIIGHSHGGPTARYVASVYPNYVASVSSIAGVNWGSRVADLISGAQNGDPTGIVEGTVTTLGNALASLIDLLSNNGGYPQDIQAALHDLTTEASVAFNAIYPEGMPTSYCGHGKELASNGVRYFSWSGATPVTTLVDPSDWLMGATGAVFNEKTDGMVSSCSSHLGTVIRDDYRMNHLDEVNQMIGLVDLFSTDPVTVIRTQANRLKNKGL